MSYNIYRVSNPECPHCAGNGYVKGTEIWGREPDRCGGYTMEVMDARSCPHCNGDGYTLKECHECGEKYDHGESECPHCGTGDKRETLRTSTVHVARKAHNTPSTRAEIRPGDTYRRTVSGGYVEGGGRWMDVRKTRLEKGPAWESQAI
jgi:RecJ-like exonuclease